MDSYCNFSFTRTYRQAFGPSARALALNLDNKKQNNPYFPKIRNSQILIYACHVVIIWVHKKSRTPKNEKSVVFFSKNVDFPDPVQISAHRVVIERP